MNPKFRLRQVWTVARLQLGRVFFSRRSFWVYMMALFPAIPFLGRGIEMKVAHSGMSAHITPAAVLESLHEGDSEAAVLERAGKPIIDRTFQAGPQGGAETFRFMRYYDGERRWDLNFKGGVLQRTKGELLFDFGGDRLIFARMFQYFYLRLAIFFSCLGIFMNLFRGELMDKTLHYWLLAPLRREVLLAGKYLAGLIAAVLIFTAGTCLCFGMMLWPHDPELVSAYWQSQGLSHLFWYAASAALGCVGYGSVFLAAGLLLRNPILPAIVILLWESINGILPAALQRLSVLYYVQALCPVPAPGNPDTPLIIRLLLSPTDPPSVTTAVLGLLAVTAFVLWVASRYVRRLEIDYNTD